MDGWMDGRMDGWMDGWVDGWMGGWVDGWKGGDLYSYTEKVSVISLLAVSILS